MDKIQNNLTAPLSNPLDVTTEEKIRNQAYEKVISFLVDLENAVTTPKSKLLYRIAKDGVQAMIDGTFDDE